MNVRDPDGTTHLATIGSKFNRGWVSDDHRLIIALIFLLKLTNRIEPSKGPGAFALGSPRHSEESSGVIQADLQITITIWRNRGTPPREMPFARSIRISSMRLLSGRIPCVINVRPTAAATVLNNSAGVTSTGEIIHRGRVIEKSFLRGD